jgi:drug/metabolite transporter (DMT)-like permease
LERDLLTILNKLDLKKADYAMMLIVVTWGLHFVVVKDGLSDIEPLVFQALRFSLGAPVFLLIASRNWSILKMARRDFLYLLLLGLIGPVGYQLFFILGLERTTSTNIALLMATMPAWTALLSILFRQIAGRARLYFWIVATLIGISLVILGRGGANLSLSHQDLIGSGFGLAAAFFFALYSVLGKPVIDRYRGLTIAIWTFWMSWLAMVLFALPQLFNFSVDSIPAANYPHLIYSGIFVGVGGYMGWAYALQEIGPARAASYNNFTPLVSAIAAVILLGEIITLPVILGGLLILFGVAMVRFNMRSITPGHDASSMVFRKPWSPGKPLTRKF